MFFDPGNGPRSRTTGASPALASSRAAVTPAGPAPTTIASGRSSDTATSLQPHNHALGGNRPSGIPAGADLAHAASSWSYRLRSIIVATSGFHNTFHQPSYLAGESMPRHQCGKPRQSELAPPSP